MVAFENLDFIRVCPVGALKGGQIIGVRYNCSTLESVMSMVRRLQIAALALVAVLTPQARAQPDVSPKPSIIPAQTPVADLLLLAEAPGQPSAVHASAQPFWPLRPGEELRLVYPLAVPAEEIDPYGWRYSPSRQAWRMHAGQDLVAPEGTPVLAMLPGRVVLVEVLDGYGLTVLLDHGRGWQTLYAHLLEASVQPGDFLPAATVLGRVGVSGRATGPHLHAELRRRDGDRTFALDPTPLLNQATRHLPVSPPPPLINSQGLRALQP